MKVRLKACISEDGGISSSSDGDSDSSSLMYFGCQVIVLKPIVDIESVCFSDGTSPLAFRLDFSVST